jgi:hypothetical protein
MDLRERKQQDGEHCMMRSFINCTLRQILWGLPTERTLVGEMRSAHKILVRNPEENCPL